MQLPCIEVSQLAPSISFYAAVLQPLGLRYLLSESVASGPDFATFGCCRGPVLHLRQIARPTALRLSTIRISAPTPASIQAFYRQGLEAAPASMFAVDDSLNHSTIFDLDGNRMQAVYTGHVCRPNVTTGQYTLVLDPQQDTHVFQVLDWNNCKPEHCGVQSIDDSGRTTETLDNQGSREPTNSFLTKTEDTNTPIGGMSTVLGALMGVAAGAAAGAAITYGVLSAKKPGRLAPANAASGTGTIVSEGQLSVKEPEPYSTAHLRVFSSSTNPAQASKGSSEFTTVASSLTSKREQSNTQDLQQSGFDAKSSVSKVSSVSRLKETSSPKPRSTIQSTEVSQPSSRTAPHRPGTTEYFDSRSHVSARQKNVSASRNPSGEDSRNHISAKDVPLPPSRVGSNDFYDTQSHVSAWKTDVSASRHRSSEVKRSHVSAKDVPLPPSRVGTSEFFDTRSQVSAKKSDVSAGHHHNMEDKRSRVSTRDIPLPSNRVGTGDFFDTVSHVSARKASSSASRKNAGGAEDLRSHVSARNIALPASCVDGVSKAVSVSLPTWESNIGYEEGASWVVSRMTTGYPRSVTELSHAIVSAYGREDQQAMLFSTPQAVERCLDFMRKRALEALAIQFQSISFELNLSEDTSPVLSGLASTIAAALFPADAFGLAKQYWQHTGDGVSSRRAEFFHDLLRAGIMVPSSSKNAIREITLKSSRGPKRYQRTNSVDETAASNLEAVFATSNDTKESSRFLEERFGRNLDLSLAKRAKSAIRRRIAGSLVSENDLVEGAVLELPLRSLRTRNLSESDIYLFPTGMNAIFNAHRALMAARGRLQSVSFGFPYVDTLKILEKFGPGCIFYGHGSSSDLNELEKRLEKGERLLALFCEFPGNPLLASPDLQRIRRLADIFDFAVVVDETIGTFANVNVLQSADIVVSSLTKIFSGDSNVMGGSAVLNPSSKYYRLLKSAMDTVVEDNYWPEDIIFMERNSRDFLNRVERVNANAEAICDILRGHSLVKDLFYPKFNPSRDLYERFRLPHGGYGGLLSVVFHHQVSAQAFYDAMDIAKGPSLGTNFTLCSPYALLAHYNELPWAAQFGVDPDLVRVSVGLEDKDILSETFCRALQAAENATKQIDEQRTEVQHWT
ncbi:hypothetical protein NHJ6243_009558 [Beauveria neobassiana]